MEIPSSIVCVCVCVCVCVLVTKLFPTLCNPMDYITCQALLSMGFPRQEYWNRLPFPSPEDLPDPGIQSIGLAPSPALEADSLLLKYQESPTKSTK